jgi:hypothetical protein
VRAAHKRSCGGCASQRTQLALVDGMLRRAWHRHGITGARYAQQHGTAHGRGECSHRITDTSLLLPLTPRSLIACEHVICASVREYFSVLTCDEVTQRDWPIGTPAQNANCSTRCEKARRVEARWVELGHARWRVSQQLRVRVLLVRSQRR